MSLLAENIEDIKKRALSGDRQRSIANELGVHESTISRIVTGKAWTKNPKMLTKRQAEILNYISSFAVEHGDSPSRREISDYFGWSSANSAQCHISALRKKGWVLHLPLKARTAVAK